MPSSPTPTLEMQTPSHSSPTLSLSSSPTISTYRAYAEPQVIDFRKLWAVIFCIFPILFATMIVAITAYILQGHAHPGIDGQPVPQSAWYFEWTSPPPPQKAPLEQNAHSHQPPPSTHPIGPVHVPQYYAYPYPPHQFQADIPYWGKSYASQGYYPATYGQPSPAAPAHGPWQHGVLPSIPSLHADIEHTNPQTHVHYSGYDRKRGRDASHAPRVGNFAPSIGAGRPEWPTYHTNDGSTRALPGRTYMGLSPASAQEVSHAWANIEDVLLPQAQDGNVLQESREPVCHEASPARKPNSSSKTPRKRKSRVEPTSHKVPSLLEQLIHRNAVLLCEQYIMESKNGKLLLSQIYQSFMDDFPILSKTDRYQTKRWRDTIRNILSTKRRFYRVKRPRGEYGYGGYWKVNPLADQEGCKARHRAPATSTSPSDSFSPTPDHPCPAPSTSTSGFGTLEMAMVTRTLPRIPGMPALLSPEEIFT